MTILVTGSRGFVGSRITGALPAPSLRGCTQDTIKQMIDQFEPDLLIHTAAISDIAACQKDPDASRLANIQIPVWIAETGVRAVFFSTDQVYSGCTGLGPYMEDEAVPANLYAEHKLEMEQRVLDIRPDAVVLRATWMYDMPIYGMQNRGNFLVNMLLKRELAFSSTQHRAVTYVREVADLVKRAGSLPGGVYNFGSENDLTMLETARWLAETLHLPVRLQDAGERHHLWMDCGKLKRCGLTFQNTVDGLKQCIRDYRLDL